MGVADVMVVFTGQNLQETTCLNTALSGNGLSRGLERRCVIKSMGEVLLRLHSLHF